MTKTLRSLTLALLATGLMAGCGDEIDKANDAVDRTQERVDDAQRNAERAEEAVKDPVGAAEREADKALEDAITPEDQP